MPMEALDKVGASISSITPSWIDECEYIKVLNVHVLGLSKPRIIEININRQPLEVTIPSRAEEWGCLWISGAKIVSDRGQRRDEAVAPIHQRGDTEFIEDVPSSGGGGEEPVEVVLDDALGEENEDSEEIMRIVAETAEYRGSE